MEIWTSGLDIDTKTTSMAAVRLNDVGSEFEQLVLRYWKIKLLFSFLKQVKCKLQPSRELKEILEFSPYGLAKSD